MGQGDVDPTVLRPSFMCVVRRYWVVFPERVGRDEIRLHAMRGEVVRDALKRSASTRVLLRRSRLGTTDHLLFPPEFQSTTPLSPGAAPANGLRQSV